MADINSIVGNSSTQSTTPATITNAVKQQGLGQDAFLKLLTVQLKNQDPSDPVKNQDFVAQLAQFSSLEQLQQINKAVSGDTNAQAMSGLQQSVDSNAAISLIGREVNIPIDTATYSGQGDVSLGYNLAGPANRVDIGIFDGQGNLVRTLTDTSPQEGNGSVIWDGKNDNGQQVSAGTYHIVPQAVNGAGDAVTVTAQLTGKVQGVRYDSGKPILMLDSGEAPLSSVGSVSQSG